MILLMLNLNSMWQAILTSLAGSALQAGLSNDLNRDAVRDQMSTNNLYQRRLMQDAPAIQAAGMKAAGFSPAFIGGGNISTPSSNAAQNAPQVNAPSFDLANLMNVEAQNRVLDEQRRKTAAEAEAQELANRKEKANQKLYHLFSSTYHSDLFENPSGSIISKDDFDKLKPEEQREFSPVIAPDVWSKEGLELKSGMTQKQIGASNALNDYQQALYIAKADPKLIEQSAKLDSQTVTNLEKTASLIEQQSEVQKSIKALNIAMTNKAISEKEITDLEKDIKNWMWQREKSTSTSGLLKKLFDEGLSFEGVIKLLAAMIVKNMSGNMKFW